MNLIFAFDFLGWCMVGVGFKGFLNTFTVVFEKINLYIYYTVKAV